MRIYYLKYLKQLIELQNGFYRQCLLQQLLGEIHKLRHSNS